MILVRFAVLLFLWMYLWVTCGFASFVDFVCLLWWFGLGGFWFCVDFDCLVGW